MVLMAILYWFEEGGNLGGAGGCSCDSNVYERSTDQAAKRCEHSDEAMLLSWAFEKPAWDFDCVWSLNRRTVYLMFCDNSEGLSCGEMGVQKEQW